MDGNGPQRSLSHPRLGHLERVRFLLCLLTLLTLSSCTAQAQSLCPRWNTAQRLGTLEPGLLPEASGMAFSTLEPERLYHLNDSGQGPYFYVGNARGGDLQKVRIAGYDSKNSDFEAMGSVQVNGKHLLILADIGDNARKWQYYELIVLEEQDRYGESVPILARVRIRYPDGKGHDAEGMAVHPNGDLFVLTKEGNPRRLQTAPSSLYRLPRAAWTGVLEAGGNREPLTLEPWGTLDLPRLAPGLFNLLSTVTTDLSIRPDGGAFLVLTYSSAFEFSLDLSSGKLPSTWQENRTFRQINGPALEQQEALAYLPTGRGFVYSSEVRALPQPLMQVSCADR